jgi:dihydropteroate synthase
MQINCNGVIVDLSQPKIMGVINVNDDSFFSLSRSNSIEATFAKACHMLENGAQFIDLGAMSSRPGAKVLCQKQEWEILQPHIEKLMKINDIILSIDTVWSVTAQNAINSGASMINDISGGQHDQNMFKTISCFKNIPYIMMHMRGNAETMQSLTNYHNLMDEIIIYFSKKIQEARSYQINDLIIDPGFGFAKNLKQNYELLQKLFYLRIFDLPILCGLSRKSMLYKKLNITPDEALNATTVANTLALVNGCSILRVHDVKEAYEAIQIFEGYVLGD